MAKDLRAKKEEIRKEWEECFETKIEDKLNEKGLEHFWSDDTSEEEAVEMLTAAAIDSLIDMMLDDIVGVAIISKKPKHKEQKDAPKGKLRVVRVADKHVYEKAFNTEEEAQDFIANICLTSDNKVSDFKVVDADVVEIFM